MQQRNFAVSVVQPGGKVAIEIEFNEKVHGLSGDTLWLSLEENTSLDDAEALLTPTLPIVACPVADVDERLTTLGQFTRFGNFVGACGLLMPAGFSSAGLPIGVQLLGRAGAESQIAALGALFQSHSAFHQRMPDLTVFGL